MKVLCILLVIFIAQVICTDNLENISDDELVLTIKSEEFVIVLFGMTWFNIVLRKIKFKHLFSQLRKTVMNVSSTKPSC